jgi:hypothetical protein
VVRIRLLLLLIALRFGLGLSSFTLFRLLFLPGILNLVASSFALDPIAFFIFYGFCKIIIYTESFRFMSSGF